MRVGIVGCGLIGTRRARVARELGDDVVAVADSDAARAGALAGEVGARAHTDWRALVAEDIDALVVSTPNNLLLPVATAGLRAGRHVLIEKPMCRNAAEAGQLAAEARASGRLLRIGFNHRYHPALAKAQALAASGEIGPLLFARAVYGHGGRPGYEKEWRGNAEVAGGGELLDQGVHVLDLLRWFFGDFNAAQGTVATYFWPLGEDARAGRRLEDNAFALLHTASGQTAQLHTSWTQWRNRFELEVYGRDGYLQMHGLGGSYGKERLVLGKRHPESKPPAETTWEFEAPDRSWHDEWAAFRADVRDGTRLSGNVDDGVAVMRLVAALYDSAAKGARVELLP